MQKRNPNAPGWLLIGFFVPVYLRGKKTAISIDMLNTYSPIYFKRCMTATLTSITIGEFLDITGFPLLATVFIGMFVVFTGLCSVYLSAMHAQRRKQP